MSCFTSMLKFLVIWYAALVVITVIAAHIVLDFYQPLGIIDVVLSSIYLLMVALFFDVMSCLLNVLSTLAPVLFCLSLLWIVGNWCPTLLETLKESRKLENPKEPETLSEKRAQLRRLREHCEEAGGFLNVAIECREMYLALEKEIVAELKEYKSYVDGLSADGFLSVEYRNLFHKTLNDTSVDAMPLQEFMMSMVQASRKQYEELQVGISELHRVCHDESVNKMVKKPTGLAEQSCASQKKNMATDENIPSAQRLRPLVLPVSIPEQTGPGVCRPGQERSSYNDLLEMCRSAVISNNMPREGVSVKEEPRTSLKRREYSDFFTSL